MSYHDIPYSLNFSKGKIFAVFRPTTKFYPRNICPILQFNTVRNPQKFYPEIHDSTKILTLRLYGIMKIVRPLFVEIIHQ